jgi:hypothetical protein
VIILGKRCMSLILKSKVGVDHHEQVLVCLKTHFLDAIRGDGPARTLSASDRSRMNARPGSSSPIPRMANLGAGYKSAELQQSAKASASQVGTTRTGAGGVSVGGGNAGATPAPATTKVAPAPAPTAGKVAPTPAPTAGKVAPTPAPTAGKVAPTPAGGSALDRATAAASGPTAFSPKPQSDVGAMIARSQARQAAQTPKPAASAPARPMGGARGRLMSYF